MSPEAGYDRDAYVDFESAVAAARGYWGTDDLAERKAQDYVDEDFFDCVDNLDECRQNFEDNGRWGARGVIIGTYNRSLRVMKLQLPLLKEPTI